MAAASLLPIDNPALAAAIIPPGFEDLTVATGLTNPTTFAFTPDGRIFVAEMSGVVRVIKDGALLPDPLIDIQDRVNDFWNRGLLGMTIDPDFSSNGFLYLAYTYENDPADYTGTKTARLTRVTVLGDTASLETEVVLLGTVVGASCSDFPVGSDCIPSDAAAHTIGDVLFAPDGTLFVTTGDASRVGSSDAIRAQDIGSLAGKVLRIHPDGTGVEGNPFWNGDPNAIPSKVWARGLRNPFRLTIRPDTGMLYVGDVGWFSWEEVDVVRAGANLGWPCYEGPEPQLFFESLAVCQALYLLGPVAVTDPLYSYPTPAGGSVTGGDFAITYPNPYAGAYFFGDYVHSWIKYLVVDIDDTLVDVQTFATGAGGPVALHAGPDGELYYLAFDTGELRHIRSTSGNRDPIAVADAPTSSGLAPLEVQFSSIQSWDPDLDSLSFLWDFGDDAPDSIEANPSHTYTVDGFYTATLTVDDGQGGQGTDTVMITVGNQAPTATIVEPLSGATYQTDELITYSGSALDPEDGALPNSALAWTIILHHGNHTHPFISHTGAGGSFVIPDHGDDNWFEIVLTATDSVSLQDTRQIFIFPQNIQLTLEAVPSGLHVVYQGRLYQTPATVTTVANASRTIRAPSPQLQDGFYAVFDSWSDSGAQEHPINTGIADSTISAEFQLLAPDADFDGDGCTNAAELDTNEVAGGQRDPLNFWDFTQQWVGVPPAKNGTVTVGDMGAVVARFGTAQDPALTEEEALAEALTQPMDATGYHASADRSGSAGPNPWNLLPPNGTITVGDLGAVVAQFGHFCA